MKTNNAESLFNESNIREETFKIPESIATFPHTSPAKGTERLTECFNSLLANEFALFTKTLNFHWNVTGPRFHSIHKFLDDHYHELLKVIDSVAERVREIGGHPMGTLSEFQKTTSLVERPGVQPDTSNMIADLYSDHESIQIQIKAILREFDQLGSDPGSEDFLTALLKKHEKMAWMLKSHLEG